MFNQHVFENSRPDGIGVMEVPGGEEGQSLFVPLKRTELRGEVTGPLGALRLVQTFRYSKAKCDRTLEALYRFPLPGDAAVTAVRVRFGNVEIRADLRERGQAEQQYNVAKKEGRQAALVTRETPDVFTLQVAGIQPDQDIVIETSFVLLARPEGAGWSLRIPLTTSPRYVRQDELEARQAQGQPLALLRDPGHRFALDISLRGAREVSCTTHKLALSRVGNVTSIQLSEKEVVPDRDCVLRWLPAAETDRPALQVFLHDEPAMEQVYFLALVAPPATRDHGRTARREVTLLVDHSGSMEGAKWQAADWAVERFLSSLSERDFFALGLFHNTTRWWNKKPEPAGSGAIAAASAFLKEHRDSGGTELGVALEQALAMERASGKLARHVLLITDAEVTDAGRILRLADDEVKAKERRRISLLCIDASPNAVLANELAERGGGVARFLTSNPEEGDIATALDEVLADWSEPVLTGMRLQVNRPTVEAAGHDVNSEDKGYSFIDLGDLPAGRPVWVAGRVPRGNVGDLSFRVTAAQKWEIASYQVDAGVADARTAYKALFGARRVRGLEYLMNAGYKKDELRHQLRRLGYPSLEKEKQKGDASRDKVYAENARMETTELLKDLLVRESLNYGIACAETAFVAVRTEAGKPVEGTVLVANALPSGWSERFLGAGAASGIMLCAMASPVAHVRSQARGMSARKASRGSASKGQVNQPANDYFADFDANSSACFAPPAAAAEEESSVGTSAVIFSGALQCSTGEAVLFDSKRDADKLPADTTLSRLEIRYPDGAQKPEALDSELALWLFLDDMVTPRAKVRLVDLSRQGGSRPLNLRRRSGQALRVVIVDPNGAWKAATVRMEVTLAWT